MCAGSSSRWRTRRSRSLRCSWGVWCLWGRCMLSIVEGSGGHYSFIPMRSNLHAAARGSFRAALPASARTSTSTSIIMQSAVPRVLNCSDLLTEIFIWLGHAYTGYHNYYADECVQRDVLRGTLCQAALVCQAFTPHALDNLWCIMDDLLPLLSLLPPLSCADGDDDAYVFSRPVEPEEWQRFDMYAHRVRVLYYFGHDEASLHPSVWTHLQEHYGGTPMLPRLNRLDVMAFSPHNVSPFSLFLSPALRSLTIAFGSSITITLPIAATPVGAMMRDAIARSSPGLHTLHLRHSSILTMPLACALAELHQLRELLLCQCTGCFVSGRSPLWTVPLADSLRVCVIAVKDIPDTFATGSFRSLRELSVNGLPGDVANFIRGIQPIALHKFSTMVLRNRDETTLPPRLSSICSHLPPALEHFSLTFNGGCENDSPCALSAILADMRPLRHVTSFTLHGFQISATISEEDARILGELWPQLRSLKHTRYRSKSHSRGTVTMQGLAEIARRWPALESLSLPRLDVADMASVESEMQTASHGLRFIEFQEIGETSEPSLVASAIARLFPRLKLDKSVGGQYWHEGWEHVRAILCEMSDAT
ncbi:hypothetical protein OH76DRAFT_310770 [Lentinus brumalis]|uniref:F-box domain-containing protein n=1 Tax=Lentinus brumalis TaxID=2498619 RepID=A0A371CK73_9APHY|nr:hypothetical protein OH76DRAFT_310770 [Polyporus brumalis]